MARGVSEWAKEFEAKLAGLAPDMQATEALFEQEGFRVDSGNKSSSGWWLTAYNKAMRQESIKVQSDGSKIVMTVAGPRENTNELWRQDNGYRLSSSGTLQPFSASSIITCLCNQTFIAAESLVSPV